MGLHITKEIDFEVLKLLPKNLNGLTILDLGAGFGWLAWRLKCATDFVGSFRIIGVDIDRATYIKQKRLGLYDQYFCNDVSAYLKRCKPKDIVVAVELLEHNEKNKSLDMIDQIKRVAKQKIILSVPLGFQKTKAEFNNKFNVHLSAWDPSDFTKKGFKTILTDPLPCGRAIRTLDNIRRKIFGVPQINRHIIAYMDL